MPGLILQAGGIPLLSDLSIRQKVSLSTGGFASLYGIPYEFSDASSRTEVGMTALFTRIEAEVFMRRAEGVFSASGGHTLTIPAVPFPVALTDAFSAAWSGDFSRRDVLTISPARWMSLCLDTRADGVGDVLTQKWAGSLTLAPLSGFSAGLKADLSQALSGYPASGSWYGERWIREMALVLPWSQGVDISRGERLEASMDLVPSPVGFHLETDAAAKSVNFTPDWRDQENVFNLSAVLLLKLQPTPSDTLTASLGYQRYASLCGTFPSGERFKADASEYLSLLFAQGYLLTGIPYTELFTDGSGTILPLWADVSRGIYSPRATLGLARTYSSRLLDLFIPSSVDLTVGQDLSKDGGLSSTEVFIQPRLSMHAINLFGSLGSHSLLGFVRTDEYGMSFSGSFTRSPGEAFLPAEISIDASAGFEGLSGQHLTVTNAYKWTQADWDEPAGVEDETSLSFCWKTVPPGGVPVPLISSEIGRSAYFSHEETGEMTLRWLDSDAYHPLTVLVGHSTSLVFPKNGTITAGMNLGLDSERLALGSYAYRLVVELRLEAKLSF